MTPTRELIKEVECSRLIKMIDDIESRIIQTQFDEICDRLYKRFDPNKYNRRLQNLSRRIEIIKEKVFLLKIEM